MPRASLTPSVVVATAARVADRDGYDAVSVSAVARELGVRPASLYGHVRDREALRGGIHRLALGELAARIGAAVAGRSGRAALAGLVDAQRAYAAERPGAWTALQRPASPETAASSEAAQVAAYTLAVLRGYDLAPEAAVHATRFVAATVAGFLALGGAGAFAHRTPDVDASWENIIAALDRALRTWPAEGDRP